MKKITKYFLCILFSILAINFLLNAISAFNKNSNYLFNSKVAKNPKAEQIVTLGKDVEKQLDKTIADIKEKNGEDYPALGILYYETIEHHSSVNIIQNFIFSLIAGFSLGNIIFFIFISGLKSYKLIIALILTLFVTSTLLALSDIYTSMANNEDIKFGLSQIFWNMEICALLYFIVCIIVVGINKLYKTYHEIRYS